MSNVVNLLLILWWPPMVIAVVTELLYISSRSVYKGSHLSIFLPAFVVIFLMTFILTEKTRDLNVLLICISLKVSKVEHF